MNSPLNRIASSTLRVLADSITSGRLLPPFTSTSLQRYVSVSESADVAKELESFSSGALHPGSIARLLRLLADAKAPSERTVEKVEFVWSGPEMPGATSRDTSVVVRELFSNAEHSVLVAGFAISHGSEIFRALADRMNLKPNLVVRMFVNVSRNDDDLTSPNEIVHSFYLQFKSKHWPWQPYPHVFYDPRAVEANFSKRASLHAKCAVIDLLKRFITSANFTESGQARNIEVGVLIEDANLASSIHEQFESLVNHGFLRGIPGLP